MSRYKNWHIPSNSALIGKFHFHVWIPWFHPGSPHHGNHTVLREHWSKQTDVTEFSWETSDIRMHLGKHVLFIMNREGKWKGKDSRMFIRHAHTVTVTHTQMVLISTTHLRLGLGLWHTYQIWRDSGFLSQGCFFLGWTEKWMETRMKRPHKNWLWLAPDELLKRNK